MDERISWVGNINAVVTPFNKSGEIDEKAFCSNLNLLMEEGIDGFLVLGATGEPWALSDAETARLFELACEICPDDKIIIAGCSDIMPQRVLDRAILAKKAGVDGIMFMPPYSILPSLDEVKDFYQYISDSIQIPILAYNIPEHQGFNMPPAFIAQLAAIENVVAIKQSADDFMDVVEVVRLGGDKLRVLTGFSIVRGLPALAVGADGFISSKEPQVLGKEGIDLYRSFKDGDLERSRQIQMRCLELSQILGAVGSFPSNLKSVMNILGRPGGYPRPPFKPLTKDEEDELRRLLKKNGFLKT